MFWELGSILMHLARAIPIYQANIHIHLISKGNYDSAFEDFSSVA